MDKNRIWLFGSALVMVVVVALGVLLGIQPQLAAVAAAEADRASVEASNAGQSTVLTQLIADYAGIEALKAELAPLEASVPSGTRMSSFVTQLDGLAAATRVTFSGLTVADAVPYVSVAAPVDPAAAAAAADAPTNDSSAEAPAAPAVSTAGVPPVTSPQITTDNFASLAVDITVVGTYADTLTFVNGLQTGQRLVLVTGLAITPGEEGSDQVSAIISGLVYVLVPPAAPVVTAAE